jgi:hypothetical protein
MIMINAWKRAAALGAATVALTAGAVAGTVGTASAAPQNHHPSPTGWRHCVVVPGHWARVWHPVYRDRDWHHRASADRWNRVWRPAHLECHHRDAAGRR